MKIIYYLNQDGELRTVDFNQVLSQWISINGGLHNVIQEINKMNSTEREGIYLGFIKFFTEKYNCQLPDYESNFHQSELYNSDLYLQALFKLQYEHNTRPSSPHNILFIIILAFAVLGILSMCR